MTLRTKEGTPLSWPDAASDEPWPGAYGGPRPTGDHDDDDPEARVQAARAALADEWRAADPRTPEQISAFYQHSRLIGPDLEAWHARPDRAEATRMLVHVATQATGDRGQATDAPFRVVDIGCGAGHDLMALHQALPTVDLEGVEPNKALRARVKDQWAPIRCTADVRHASIEHADLLVCIDVLEHVPDPEGYLGSIAQRAPLGCLLFEAVATSDLGTPLHLPANAGWKPGRVLERHGWEMVDSSGRVRVWRREQDAGTERAGLLLCAYRGVSTESLQSIMGLCAGPDQGNRWRLRLKANDALIARSRSILLTEWWRSTADDVALMVDDDVAFAPGDADHIVALCRDGHPVVCGAYPVRNGAHLALRYLDGTQEVRLGSDEPPVEVRYPATGFVAIHRRVIDALIAGAATDGVPMPLLHPRQSWSFYNLFPTMVIDDGAQGPVLLSEDWSFGELCRRAGFAIYLDPTVRLHHASSIPVSVSNMADVHAAIQKA